MGEGLARQCACKRNATLVELIETVLYIKNYLTCKLGDIGGLNLLGSI
jgi:hypothetical protein